MGEFKKKDSEKEIIPNYAGTHIEVDEMYSFIKTKSNKAWIWVAIDKYTGLIVAHKTGDRSEETLKELLKEIPNKIVNKCIFYTDKWKAYNILPKDRHVVGKKYTRRVERVFLTFRSSYARLVRRSIRYSKSKEIHNIILDLLVYFYNEKIMSNYEK
nr:IS1 family transposase [Methanothermococcus sp.]